MPSYAAPVYQPAPVGLAPGFHEHDGFYMRLLMGGGYLSTKEKFGGNTYTLSGGAVAFSAAFGGAVAPNLIIYGELGGMSVNEPSVSGNGSSGTAKGLTLNMISFGPGLAYYVQPMNLYVSGTFNFTKFSMSDNNNSNNTADSDTGFGFSATLGKEWWVSTDWGLGAAAQFNMGTAKADSGDTTLTGIGFAVMFSATYN